MSRQRITQEIDKATRQALIELVRKHPERTLSELLAMDNVGHRVGELTVGELITGATGSRAGGAVAKARGPQPQRVSATPRPISTRTAAEQTAHDERVLAAMRGFDASVSTKELRDAVPEGSDYQLTSALRRLLRKRRITQISRGRGARYEIN